MSGTGRLDYGQRKLLIVDVVLRDEAGGANYLDRMTVDELEDRVPWDWLEEGMEVVVTFCDQLDPPPKKEG